jgi:hypothetical protein
MGFTSNEHNKKIGAEERNEDVEEAGRGVEEGDKAGVTGLFEVEVVPQVERQKLAEAIHKYQ